MSVVHRLRGTYAEIHLPHLAENYRTLRSLLPSENFFCPMIKANAYGHGDKEVALVLQDAGAEHVGVVLVEEGIRLREAGISMGILVFGTFDSAAAQEFVRYDLTPVISSWQSLKIFEESLESDAYLRVHLKFNTGMNRLGFEVEDAKRLAQHMSEQSRFQVVGLCTHLLNGEDAGIADGYSSKQQERFLMVQKEFSDPKIQIHYLNSSALLMNVDSTSGARPGISMYGIYPPTHKKPSVLLKPVMSFHSHIALLHQVKKGEVVSYGAKWKAERDSMIGLVPVGYADGYPRSLTNRGQMLVRGKRVPVTGIVCMDYTMVNLTDLHLQKPIELNEEVVLFGKQLGQTLSVQELADLAGTIPYEIVTRLGARVSKSFIYEH